MHKGCINKVVACIKLRKHELKHITRYLCYIHVHVHVYTMSRLKKMRRSSIVGITDFHAAELYSSLCTIFKRIYSICIVDTLHRYLLTASEICMYSMNGCHTMSLSSYWIAGNMLALSQTSPSFSS